jgi:hypothetical protein
MVRSGKARVSNPTRVRAASGFQAPDLGMCKPNRIGRQIALVRNGTVITRPTTTKQFPRPIPSRPFAEPSWGQNTPWVFWP